jgi:hypothetical protein
MSGVIYSLNGVNLHDASRGWRVLRAGTNTQGGFTKSTPKVSFPGMDGYQPGPSNTGEQILIFVVRTTRAGLEPLLALADAATTLALSGDATKEAYVITSSAIPSGESPLDATFNVTITLSVYQGAWRDVTAVTTGPTTVSSPTQVFNILAGLSAPIRDMDIFLRGVFGQFTLTDSGGSWVKTTSAWAGSGSTGILFMGSTGQAFLANESSPWTPVTDVSGQVDVSGNGGFRMTPKMVSGNPSNREVELTLTTLTQTSTTLRVRAKRAYRMV